MTDYLRMRYVHFHTPAMLSLQPSRRVDQAGITKCLFNYIRLPSMKDAEKHDQCSRRMIQKWGVNQTVARTFCRLGLIRLIGSRCIGRRDGAISDCVERDRAYD